MKIAVYAIAKNEEHNVAAWVKALKDADGIFVLDTGSTDNTVALLQEAGVTVNRMNAGKPFRFNHARNEAASLVPEGFDILVSLDLDEAFVEGWKEAIISGFSSAYDVADYTLVSRFDPEDGAILESYPRCAIHRRGCATWQYAVHEVLVPNDINKPKVSIPATVVHYGQGKQAGHYLDLLITNYAENENDPRALQYLAREYFYLGNFNMAIPLYEKYVSMDIYAPFRAEAALNLAHMMPTFQQAEWWYRQAIQFCGNIREPYCKLAAFYFKHGQYEHVIPTVLTAQRIPRPDYDMIYSDNFYVGPWCDWMLMSAYQKSGNIRMALITMQNIKEKYKDIPADLASDIEQVERAKQEAYYVFVDSLGLQR